MSKNEEVLDDFPTENPITTAEFMVGAYRAESTNEWTAKIPPSYDGSTSWLKYEEPVERWLDLIVLEFSQRGPALKNRLFGIAEKYKPLLSGAHSVFFWRFLLIYSCKGRKH